MAITKLNSLAIPAGTVEPADISYPLTNFSSTGIDDNADATAITIDSNERVGIGTSSPSTPLHVQVGASTVGSFGPYTLLGLSSSQLTTFEINSGSNSGAYIKFNDSDGFAGQIAYSHSTNAMSFWANGSERMSIDSSGNVGIGDSAPETPLHIRTTNKLGSTFTGSTRGEGITVEQTNYTNGNYISLIEAPYTDGGVPAVRIGSNFSGDGSTISFGTSNNYGNGVTNEALTISYNGSAIFNQAIANATAPYASTDSFIQLYNSTAAKTGTLVTAGNGNTWLNADGGKTLWLNWASYSSPASYADIMLGDGNEGNFILHIDGSTGCINTNGDGGTTASSQAEKGSIFVGATFGANISGDNGGGGMFASNIVLNSSNQAKVAFDHTGGYGYAGVHTAWGGINFYGNRANVTAGDAPKYVAQFLANAGQGSHPEQRYFGLNDRLIERRNFYQTRSTASGQTYWHFKTNISWGGTSQMYAIHFTGQNYNGSKVIDLNLSFYNYVPSGQPINVGSSSSTSDSATVYESSDGYIVLRYQFNAGNTYYSSIILSQYDTAQGLQTFTVSASAASSTAAYY